MTFGSLFAGIGGFDLGLERAGMECRWQVEIDDYASRVLAKHWPHVQRWGDVRTFPPGPAEEWRVDLICAGVPCQPVSHAGKQKGADDERWMWGEALRVVADIKPTFFVAENPIGILNHDGGRSTYANGTLSPLPTLVPRTEDNGSGLWPTPTVFHALRGNHDEPVEVYQQPVQDHKDGKTKGKPGPSLGIAVRLWPTPKASAAGADSAKLTRSKTGLSLQTAVRLWPTPTAGDSRSSGSRNTETSKASPGISLTDAVRGDGGKGRRNSQDIGALNPNWVDWLMGYPTGWTDLGASETP